MRRLERLLVANRGEIAARVVRSARDRFLPTVAVCAPGDEALAARYGADAIAAVARYDECAALVAAAEESGADAVHPGYGFLSESAAFAAAVRARGLAFVGPPTDALALWGDKVAARGVAEAAGVPVAAGAVVADAAAAAAFVRREGPAFVKARGGGGGRGTRRVDDGGADMGVVIAACRAEAASFGGCGDGGLLIEAAIDGARHVEVCVESHHWFWGTPSNSSKFSTAIKSTSLPTVSWDRSV